MRKKIGFKTPTWVDKLDGMTIRRCGGCNAALFEVVGKNKTRPISPHMDYCPHIIPAGDVK